MADHPDPAPGSDAGARRRDVEDAQRRAHAPHPKNFQDEALADKQVHIEPDGIGPSPTGTMDTPSDQRAGSGNAPEADATRP